MNTAREINFLTTEPVAKIKRMRWNALAKFPILQKMVKPIATRDGMYANEGGFEFEYAPNITYQSGVAGGLVGTLLFGLVGGAVALGTTTPFDSSMIAGAIQPLSMTSNSSLAIQESSHSASSGSEVTAERVMPKVAPPSSPKSVLSEVESNTEAKAEEIKMNKTVLGFLPYWSLDAVDEIDFNTLTTLAYFDIGLLSDGSVDSAGPGMSRLESGQANRAFARARETNTDIILTFTAFKNAEIESLVSIQGHRDRAINHMVSLVKKHEADGVNIDVEYQGNATDALRQSYTEFVRQAASRLHEEVPGSKVTTSMYAGSAKYSMLYEVGPLSEAVDGIFVMAYDFATAGSSNAGPNAPLTGSPKTYWYDISTALDDFRASGVPSEKMILGVPFYGYDWPTTGQAPKSVVVPGYAGAITYAGVQKIIAQHGGERKWDYEANAPYVAYTDGGQERVIYYDDTESLSLKYDVVNSQNLMGVGIWALGQDGGADELWQLLERKFGSNDG